MSEEQFAASLEAAADEPTVARVSDPGVPYGDDTGHRPVPHDSGQAMNEPEWKQEVASRLEKYQARRGRRRPRYEGSLSLDFERAANRMAAEEAVSPQPLRSAQGELVVSQTDNPEYQPQATAPVFQSDESAYVPEPEPEVPEDNLIVFPRTPTLFEPVMPPSGDELAEPIIDRPRIYEVPEEVHCSQAPLAGIELEPEEPEPAELELPLRVAPMGQRVFAGMVDGVIVAMAAMVFIMVIVYLDVPPPPHGKAALAMMAALPCVLWSIYEYLFLVHAGRTPGMQLARLAISEFDGALPGRHRRRARALATVLSLFPLGLGVIWALLDEDTLCWHDRISRTYLAKI